MSQSKTSNTVENVQIRLPKADIFAAASPIEAIEAQLGIEALRWYIAQIDGDELVIEVTFDRARTHATVAETPIEPRGHAAVVSIVPTGVGCELGGYAGDAAPATALLATAADYVVTNPNAVNASSFVRLDSNVLYTEGLCIDQLMKGEVNLWLPRGNRVGLIVEKAPDSALDTVFNVVNAVRAVHGIDIDCEITPERIGSHCRENASGAYVGTVDRPQVLLAAAERLVERGARALGVTTNIQDLPHDAYVKHFTGDYPNPMGGVEAIMSHLLVDRLRLPAAHAPMINWKDLDLVDPVVDARGGGELASESGLACVLIGLARAPQITRERARGTRDALSLSDVLAVVAPAGCLGGIPVLAARQAGIPVIAVAANKTILDVSAAALGLDNVIPARNYAEAAGVILALRNGIALDSIDRPFDTLRPNRRGARKHAGAFASYAA